MAAANDAAASSAPVQPKAPPPPLPRVPPPPPPPPARQMPRDGPSSSTGDAGADSAGAAGRASTPAPDPSNPAFHSPRSDTSDSASTPVPPLPPPVLTRQDIAQYSAADMSRKLPHETLSFNRLHMACAGEEVRDLTNVDKGGFDWRVYVCKHHRANDIIGEGVVKFELRFLSMKEANGKALVEQGVPQQFAFRRCDFIVHQVNGSHCRLHPGKKGTFIVFGNLDE